MKENLQLTFFTMAPVRPTEDPHEETASFCCASTAAVRGRPRLARFTFLLTVCDVVPAEVEQLYQKTYL